MLVAATAWLAMLLLQGIYLQTVRGMSALEAGLALMPLTGAAVISAPIAGHYAERVGARVLIVAGMGFLALSLGSWPWSERTRPTGPACSFPTHSTG